MSEVWLDTIIYPNGASFLRVYVHPNPITGETADAEILCRLEYQSQPHSARIATEQFQFWKLTLRPDRTATLTCDDDTGKIVFTKELEFTDFPLDEVMLSFTNDVIFLPSEH